MKILFLHLSDLHIKNSEARSTLHIKKMLDTLRAAGKVDRMIIIFSGDVAFSGSQDQYEVATHIIGTIISTVKRERIYNGYIDIICVPGNHDVAYENPPRTTQDLNTIYSEWAYERNLPKEFEKQKEFFNFSNKSKCFCKPAVFDQKILTYNDFTIEVNMINTAVFSLKEDEDKGLHYITQSAINTLNTPTGADFVISVMHHAPDWYVDDQKNQLEVALFCKSSLLFYGHEHRVGAKSCSFDNKKAAFIHAGGALCNNSDWNNSEFVLGILNTDTYEYVALLYKWNVKELQYEEELRIPQVLPKKPSVEKALSVCAEYKNKLLSGAHRSFSDSPMDYFVFSGIESETHDGEAGNEFFDMEKFIEEILGQKQVIITGANNSGKTTLLNALFLSLTEKGKCVVFCDIATVRRKESSKIVKTNFEDIYGTDFSDYTRFKQLPPENKVLIIDDIDQIKEQDFEAYISSISDEFGLMVFATKNVIDFNIIERVKIAIQSENAVTKYRILPFYSNKRKELISRLVQLKNKKDSSILVSETTETLCQAINLQKRYINLEPEFIINFVEYYCNNIGTALNGDSTAFSKVFEANITTSLSPYATKTLTIDKLYKLFSMTAHFIHFNKQYPVSEESILGVVKHYNEDFDDVVSPTGFLEIAKKSSIIVFDGKGYKFGNRNQLAYFCAREVNYLYYATGDETDLKYLISYSCFGINADVLMFISYITDNPRILKLFLDMIHELTKGWEELDFKKKLPEFLDIKKEHNLLAPKEEERKEREKQEIEAEKAIEKKLQTIEIYDYKEDEVEKLTNQLVRSMSLLTIISRCLPSFEHIMAAPMRKAFVNEIYTLPNKIYYTWAREINESYDELIEYLKEQEQVDYQRQSTEITAEIEEQFQLVSAALLLDIYNLAVLYATKDNSFRLLDKFDKGDQITYGIEHLMILERRKLGERFVQAALELSKKCDTPLTRFLIRSIVKHGYMSMDSLDYKLRDRLNNAFFQVGSGKHKILLPERREMLLKRNKNKEKEKQ